MSTKQKKLTTKQKLMASLWSAILFFIIAGPAYLLTMSVIPGFRTPAGCPSWLAIFVHTLVFFGAVFGIMYLPLPV